MSDQQRPNDYDSEPVTYCSRCYSLKIKYEETIDSDCCMDCGCSDVKESPIEVWEALYEKRYGHKYITKNTDPTKSFVFKLPLEKLKIKVYESPAWEKIIKTLYPKFPGGLGKADSIILLFDKLIKDRRLDDLKLLLFRMNI